MGASGADSGQAAGALLGLGRSGSWPTPASGRLRHCGGARVARAAWGRRGRRARGWSSCGRRGPRGQEACGRGPQARPRRAVLAAGSSRGLPRVSPAPRGYPFPQSRRLAGPPLPGCGLWKTRRQRRRPEGLCRGQGGLSAPSSGDARLFSAGTSVPAGRGVPAARVRPTAPQPGAAAHEPPGARSPRRRPRLSQTRGSGGSRPAASCGPVLGSRRRLPRRR